jgi:peptidylprolyl isomerase
MTCGFNVSFKTLFMKRISLIICMIFISLGLFAQKSEKEHLVLIRTTLGDIKVKLYNQTPLHRDNFLKLAKEKFYDSLLFHRVIKEFMIQGGDPQSKQASSGTMLGEGDAGYTVNAEFNPKLIHKKGVLAAAREGDNVNPEKKSSGCQFYIVQGKVFKNSDLDQLELKINGRKKQEFMGKYIMMPEQAALRQKIDSLRKLPTPDELNKLATEIEQKLAPEVEKVCNFKFTEEQRKVYTTVGGTPHLDGSYTVYGEVVEGMSVVDAIAAVATDKNDRPVSDVRIIKVKVLK